MEANLKYKQRAIVFSDLTTSTLDHLDGLTIKHGTRRAVPSLSLNCVLLPATSALYGGQD
jgi:hypothetical protein